MTYPSNGVDAGHLRSVVDRLKACKRRQQEAAEDAKEIISEATGIGFDGPALREIVRVEIRNEDEAKKRKAKATHGVVEVYATALQLDLF